LREFEFEGRQNQAAPGISERGLPDPDRFERVPPVPVPINNAGIHGMFTHVHCAVSTRRAKPADSWKVRSACFRKSEHERMQVQNKMSEQKTVAAAWLQQRVHGSRRVTLAYKNSQCQ